MDHLPSPKYPVWDGFKARCLTEDEHDGLELETFPARKGFKDRTVSEWCQLFQDRPPSFVAFLQLWRYFGVVGSMFRLKDGTYAKLNDLSTVTPNGRFIDTSKLMSMAEWFIAETTYGRLDQLRLERISSTLRKFQHIEVLSIHGMPPQYPQLSNLMHKEVSLLAFLQSFPVKDSWNHGESLIQFGFSMMLCRQHSTWLSDTGHPKRSTLLSGCFPERQTGPST